MSNIEYNELIANANMAFSSGEYETALKYAENAIKEKPDDKEGYYAAGRAYMSLDQPDKAVGYFSKAVEIDHKNGNGYFLLGYASAMAGKTAEALRSMTRAIENNCDDEVKGQIYKIMAMINTEQGDYDNALANVRQAEQYLELDYELLQQQAACYASLKDYRKTLFIINQMKLLQPKDYKAYALAFHIFMELEIYDEAKSELERASEYAELDMDYYSDRIAYMFMHNPEDYEGEQAAKRWKSTIKEIDFALKKGKPNATQAFEMYLRAAELYLSLEDPNSTLKCLAAADEPVLSFNEDFSVLLDESSEESTDSDTVVPLTPEEEQELMDEKWENGELEELSEKIEDILDDMGDADSEELVENMQQYLSPLEAVPEQEKEEKEIYKIDESFIIDQNQKDIKNTLYMTAYEMKQDYNNMLNKAIELQSSDILNNQYNGIYYELKAGKYMNSDNWQKKYRDRINFWTKRMLEDPTDYISASFRIRSYLDLGDYENAEELCSCLPADIKDTFLDEIRKAKENGDGNNGHTSE